MTSANGENGSDGFRLLIVDDEKRLREMLARTAAEIGFVAESAESAEQALRVLASRQGAIDVVLIDLNLPGAGGLELLEQLRERWPDVQAVILTGFGNLESAKRAIRLDAADFLTKPCSLGDLERALSKARQRRLASLRKSKVDAMAAEQRTHRDAAPEPDDASAVPLTLEDVERKHILSALDRHHGNRAAAAAELGISERTMYYRISRYQHDPGPPARPGSK